MTRPYVAMVDYGTGNVHSLGKALERVGCRTRLTADPAELAGAAGIVLPGVGAFGPAWRRLEATGLVPWLRELVASGRPLLGICLGMQLLFQGSREDGFWPGLGLLPGWVEPFPALGTRPGGAAPGSTGGAVAPANGRLKVPHMGWNRVVAPPGSRLLAGLGETFYAYFVHSYRVPWPAGGLEPPRPPAALAGSVHAAGMRVAVSDYGGPFVAAVEAGPVAGTQFHPEKSGPVGLQILRNFGAMCGACDPGP